MGFKNDDRCLDRVDDDEPIFVLRAQDRLSIAAIHYWVAAARDGLSPERLREVRTVIDQFAHWQAVHPNRVKRPD